jgi:hypothetical protein
VPDYAHKISALRRKAADKSATPAEAKILTAKADELEAKYGNANSSFTDDTVTTSRDGRATTVPTSEEAWRQVWLLFHQQHQWNKPPTDEEEDIVEDRFREEPEDEDYGYDMFEGEDW